MEAIFFSVTTGDLLWETDDLREPPPVGEQVADVLPSGLMRHWTVERTEQVTDLDGALLLVFVSPA